VQAVFPKPGLPDSTLVHACVPSFTPSLLLFLLILQRMLYYPNLAKACGSDQLEERIRRLRPLAHVFGHT